MQKLSQLATFKKSLSSAAITILLLAVTPLLAADVPPAGNDALQFLGQTAVKGGLTSDPKTTTDIYGLIAGIINVVLSLTGILFFLQFFYHGFRWMTAGGAEDIIKESKVGLKQALIGVTIVFSAFIATNFIINRLDAINQQPSSDNPLDAPAAPLQFNPAPDNIAPSDGSTPS